MLSDTVRASVPKKLLRGSIRSDEAISMDGAEDAAHVMCDGSGDGTLVLKRRFELAHASWDASGVLAPRPPWTCPRGRSSRHVHIDSLVLYRTD
jgi:hypothetical protein